MTEVFVARLTWAMLATLGGCQFESSPSSPPPQTVPGPPTEPHLPLDADGDGYGVVVDCNDSDPTVHPGALDPCDGLDSDCDGVIEADTDEDGFPVCAECDDDDPSISPGAPDALDAVDQDCDGVDGVGTPATLIHLGTHPRTGEALHAADLDGDGDDELVVDAWDTQLIARYTGPGVEVSELGLFPSGSDVAVIRGPAPRLVTTDVGGNELSIYAPTDAKWPSEPVGRLTVGLGGLRSVTTVGEPGAWIAAYYVYFDQIEIMMLDAGLEGEKAEPDHSLFVTTPGFLGQGTESLLADAGDRDGDGVAELALSCCDLLRETDTLRVVTPGIEVDVEDAAEIWSGHDATGGSVSITRQDDADLDGDGRPELAIGSSDDRGPLLQMVPYVGPGAHDVHEHALVSVEVDSYGYPSSALRDVDGDGVIDLVTLVTFASPSDSTVGALFLGPLEGTLGSTEQAARLFVGEVSTDWSKGSVLLADVDGSGEVDLAIGAPYHRDEDREDNGAVFLVREVGSDF